MLNSYDLSVEAISYYISSNVLCCRIKRISFPQYINSRIKLTNSIDRFLVEINMFIKMIQNNFSTIISEIFINSMVNKIMSQLKQSMSVWYSNCRYQQWNHISKSIKSLITLSIISFVYLLSMLSTWCTEVLIFDTQK